jgi:hypothetical protein
MRIPYLFTDVDGVKSLTLVLDGEHSTISGEHPRFADIQAEIAAVSTHATDDVTEEFRAGVIDKLRRMINAGQSAVDTMRQLSERVSYRDGVIYFDGDPVENALTEHIVKMIKSDDEGWSGPVTFLENLMANPAKHVRKRLWLWISDRGLTLTADGLVVGYKGVQDDELNSSITHGRNTVWVDGAEHTGHIPNPVGATVTMARSEVDNDRDAGCSQGLHVGTYGFANGFASGRRVLAVTFNPRDVVAIPADSGYQKIRVCRYTVQEVVEEALSETSYAAPFDLGDDEDND